MRRASLLVAVWLCWASPARGGQTDYLPDNAGWNGLSELADLAQGMGYRLRLLEELSWEHLPPRGTLLLIYPRTQLDSLELVAFVGRGGALLLADDFGDSEQPLRHLGIRRQDGADVRAERYHRGNPQLPVATVQSQHELTAGIREIVTNHPSVFFSSFPTIAGFRDRGQLMVAASVGRGRFVALSDPSVLINSMLRFEDNSTLATNLIRHLAPGEGDTLYLVTGHSRQRQPAGQREARAQRSPAERWATEYNQFIAELNARALRAPALRAVAFCSGTLSLVGLLLFLPLPRREPDGHWLRPGPAPRRGTDELVAHFGQNREAGGLKVPAMLREELEETLTEVLEAPGPISTVKRTWVIARARQRGGPEAGQLIETVLAVLGRLPSTLGEDGGATRSRAAATGRDLALLYSASQRLLLLLGEPRLPPLDGETAPTPGATVNERKHAID